MELPIYLDHHATTPVDPRVLSAMLPFFTEKFGNAASINHAFGWAAAEAVETAREQVARLLRAPARSLVFTSGATESNNLALKGVLGRARGGHLITSAAEHRAVLDPAAKLRRQGHEVSILPVDRYGILAAPQVAAALRDDTALVSVMLANNEVGTLNPVQEIGALCRARGVPFHCDAAQAAGKLPIDLDAWPIDLLSLSGHKLYAPKGIGVLYVRGDGPRLEPLFDGGGHERRLRSGTLPVPLIVGLGAACELARQQMHDDATRIAALRDRLWAGLQRIPGISLNGHPTERLAGNLNVSFDGVDGEALMMSLKEIAVSSGSACTSADPEPSHVLRAMGVGDALSRASLRFGIGRFNTEPQIDFAIEHVADAVQRVRVSSALRRGAKPP